MATLPKTSWALFLFLLPVRTRGKVPSVSPLLLFTSIFLFQQIDTVDAYRYGEIFSVALFYTWLSFCILEKTMTGRRSNKRKASWQSFKTEDEQTGELQLEGECYRGGSSSMGSSSGLFSAGFTPTDRDAMAVTVSASSFSHF